jgi:hypothetical protein
MRPAGVASHIMGWEAGIEYAFADMARNTYLAPPAAAAGAASGGGRSHLMQKGDADRVTSAALSFRLPVGSLGTRNRAEIEA